MALIDTRQPDITWSDRCTLHWLTASCLLVISGTVRSRLGHTGSRYETHKTPVVFRAGYALITKPARQAWDKHSISHTWTYVSSSLSEPQGAVGLWLLVNCIALCGFTTPSPTTTHAGGGDSQSHPYQQQQQQQQQQQGGSGDKGGGGGGGGGMFAPASYEDELARQWASPAVGSTADG
eukprot:COSAG06_NODE_2669_length_6468_cov_28.056367_5_plen_179_part_00